MAAHLSRSADESDHECRRALGNLEFGPHAAGSRYRAGGAAVEDGYRRLRRAFDEWVAAVNTNADVLRVAADGYAERDNDTAAELAQLSDTDALRGDLGGGSR